MKITKQLGVRVSHVDVNMHTSLLDECMNFTVVCCQLVDSSAAGAKKTAFANGKKFEKLFCYPSKYIL